jgi:glycosyltransferase involved in cell wall biosynthesis
MVTTSFPRWQGDFSGNFIHSLSRSLARRGVNITVVAPGYGQARRCEEWGPISIHRFGYAVPANLQVLAYDGGIPHKLRTSLLARLELLPFLVSMYLLICRVARGCDLIHAHWIPTGVVAGVAARRLALPMVLTVHGSDGLYLKSGRLARDMSRFSLRSASHLVAVSEALRRDLLTFTAGQVRVTRIHNGVDMESFQADRIEPAGRRILWVGRMTEEKGTEYLIRAMKRITAAYPDARLQLVGDGPLRKNLEGLVVDLGLSGAISFAGQKSHSEIAAVYSASDIVVLPSLSEGLPMALLEAMASGRPVVATRVGGIPELVDPGRNGYLVAPGSADEIADKLLELLGHPELAAEMGAASRALVESSHSWDAISSRIVSVYASVAGEPTL